MQGPYTDADAVSALPKGLLPVCQQIGILHTLPRSSNARWKLAETHLDVLAGSFRSLSVTVYMRIAGDPIVGVLVCSRKRFFSWAHWKMATTTHPKCILDPTGCSFLVDLVTTIA